MANYSASFRFIPAIFILFISLLTSPLSAMGRNTDPSPESGTIEPGTFENFTIIIPSLNRDSPFISSPGDAELLVLCQIFRGLVGLNPETGEIEPDLAESWSLSDDRRTYRFFLKENFWSDGTAVRAEDFRTSYLHMLSRSSGSQGRGYLSRFIKGASDYTEGKASQDDVGITAVNDRTLEIEFTRVYPYSLKLLAHYSFLLYPEELFLQNSFGFSELREVRTSGGIIEKPWEDKSVTEIRLKREGESGKASHILFIEVDSQEKGLELYLNGRGDWLTGSALPLSKLYDIDYRMDFHIKPDFTSYFYFLNPGKPPLDDPDLRMRLADSINRERLVNQVLRGAQLPADTLIPPELYGGDEKYRRPPEDRGGADESFDLPGPAESASPLMMIFPSDEGHRIIADTLIRQWADKAGIRVEAAALDWIDFLKAREEGEYHIALGGWSAAYNDPMSFLSLFVSAEKRWGGVYGNPAFDETLLKAQELPDGRERREILHSAESILIGDNAFLPVFFTGNPRLLDMGRWKGSPRYTPGYYTSLRYLYR